MLAKYLASGLFLVLLPLSVTAQPEPTVPIEKVVFFKSGVSFVEHRGEVRGTTTMTLRFEQDQMKDLLKSLVLQDLGDGQVGTINYPSQDPLSRRLQSFQVDLSNPQGVGALMNQLRGATVTLVTSDGSVAGRVVSAESRSGSNGAEEWFLNLYGDGAVRSVALDTVQSVQFEDETLREAMQEALGVVAEARDTGEKPVRLRFKGSGTRRVRVGYVVKAPVWKTSYRLLLPEGEEGDGQLQGWAIVENQTDADWENVDLRLVSGRPVSFVQDLYTPTYVDRPVASPTSGEPLTPTEHEEGIEGAPPAPQQAPPARQGRARSDRGRGARSRDAESQLSAPASDAPVRGQAGFDPTQGISSAATSGDEGAFFQYRIRDVSLARHGSALLPIVTESIEVERLSIFDPSLHETHPLRGARLENTTGRHLAAGPITVFDEGSYGGDARLSDTPPEDTRFISYALNQDVQVDPGSEQTQETVETGKIVQGVLTVSRKRIASQTYTIENEGDSDATVVIEHDRRQEWSLVQPEAVEKTSSEYRFRAEADAGETTELLTKEERILTEEYRLVNTNRERLLHYARTDAIPDDVRNALHKAADLQQSVTQTANELEQARERLQQYRDEQSRIRENMKAVDSETEYHQRLLDKLKSQEDEIERVTDRIESLERRKSKEENRLTRYLLDLDVG